MLYCRMVRHFDFLSHNLVRPLSATLAILILVHCLLLIAFLPPIPHSVRLLQNSPPTPLLGNSYYDGHNSYFKERGWGELGKNQKTCLSRLLSCSTRMSIAGRSIGQPFIPSPP